MKRGFIFLLAAVVLPRWDVDAAAVRLKIIDAPGTRRAFVVKGGIPLPRGAVNLPNRAGVRVVNGVVVPIQAESLAIWPDGSIKWLLVTFYAQPGQQYELFYGKDPVRAPAVKGEVEVDPGQERVVVDTGPLKLTVTRAGGALIDEVKLDGAVIVGNGGACRRNFVDYLHVEQPEGYVAGAWPVAGVPDRSTLAIKQIEVERDGPIEAVIRISGQYRHTKLGRAVKQRAERFKDAGSAFKLRIYAYAGSPVIRVVHTFTYEGCPRSDFLSGAGLALPLTLEGKDRFVTFGTPTELRQLSGRSGIVRLLQDTDSTFTIARQPAQQGAPESTVYSGERAAGWIDISDGGRGVAIAVNDMWKHYPKALEADLDAGVITAWLYPPQAQPLDLRRYSYDYALGEMFGDFGLGTACGLQKTHELAVCFHTGGPGPELQRMLEPMLHPPLLVAPPSWYASTGVFGSFSTVDEGAFPNTERLLRSMTDFYLWAQERYRWFGLLDYGDFQGAWGDTGGPHPGPGLEYNRWHSDWGRWGWNNDNGLASLSLLMAFLRTGDADYFHAGRAMVRHVQDIDTIHTNYYIAGDPSARRLAGDGSVKGAGHRGGVNHWSDGYVGSSVSNPAAKRILYFLTGDGRTRDGIEEVIEHNLGSRLENFHSDTNGSVLYSLLAGSEITGDKRYQPLAGSEITGDKRRQPPWMKVIAQEYTDFMRREGVFPDKLPYIFRENRWEDEPGEPSGKASGRHINTSGCMAALIEIAELLDDNGLRDAIVAQADSELDGADYRYHLRVVAYAYRRTGKEKYRRKLADMLGQMLDRSRGVLRRDLWPLGPQELALPDAETAINSSWLNALPYAIDALKARKMNEKSLGVE